MEAPERAPAGPGSPARARAPKAHGRLRDPVCTSGFESFLLQLSDAFVQRPATSVTPLIDEWLGRLARLIDMDRITLWEISGDGRTIIRRYMHTLEGCAPPPPVAPAGQFSWLMEQNRLGKTVVWSRLPDDIPPEARGELEYSHRIDAKSLLSIPVTAESTVCVLAFSSLRKYRNWSGASIRRLRLVASILAGAVLREQTEETLRNVEARNRAIASVLPDLLLVFSADGVYLECHDRDEADLLMPPEAFLGRRIEEVLPHDVAMIFRNGIRKVLASPEVIEAEYSLSIRGELREYEVRMVRRADGAIVSIVRNITQRSRAARLLRESEERFRSAFDHSAIGMALVGLDGRWLRSNEATSRILGYSRDELRSMDFQRLTHPDDLELNLKELRRALEGKIDSYELEKRYVHKDGHIVPALLTVSVVRDDDRRPLYFVSQLQDLTDRQNAQIKIERLHIELARFGRAALTGQLTAAFAHHMSQPVAAILLNVRACRNLIAKGKPASEVREVLQDIEVNSQRAADVIDNIRRMLRKEPGIRSSVCVNQIVQEVLHLIRPHLAARGVLLRFRLQESLPAVVGSPIELQQVLINLVVNSAEALENHPGTREIVIETSERGPDVEVRVQDSGPGLDSALLQKLFEPFFTTKPSGIGMGLAISADIVHSHGGRIWADLNESGGLTVSFRLRKG